MESSLFIVRDIERDKIVHYIVWYLIYNVDISLHLFLRWHMEQHLKLFGKK